MDRPPTCYLTADIILVVGREILLIRRGHEPFRGTWCFPGGFVDPGEKVIDAAVRELMEETGVTGIKLELFSAYGDPGRDPRGRTVSIAYWALLSEKPQIQAGDDAADCSWYSLDQLPPLGFDHDQIAQDVRDRLKTVKG